MTMLTAKQLNELARESLDEALSEAKRDIGRGIFKSRGKWVVVTSKVGEPKISNGQLEWKGTQKQLNELLNVYGDDASVEAIYIEGGVDYGESILAFSEGWYDPYVAEWSVNVINFGDK